MQADITSYHQTLSATDQAICSRLYHIINTHLAMAEAKVWHAHPVWFIAGNPIVGYSKQKAGIRLMFWSGADFDETGLHVRGANFKDASCFYESLEEVDEVSLKNWLIKAEAIQWDYKNLVKRKGVLERLK